MTEQERKAQTKALIDGLSRAIYDAEETSWDLTKRALALTAERCALRSAAALVTKAPCLALFERLRQTPDPWPTPHTEPFIGLAACGDPTHDRLIVLDAGTADRGPDFDAVTRAVDMLRDRGLIP